eukprot:Selendium_serpulae@DN4989_c0_g1_i3.p3
MTSEMSGAAPEMIESKMCRNVITSIRARYCSSMFSLLRTFFNAAGDSLNPTLPRTVEMTRDLATLSSAVMAGETSVMAEGRIASVAVAMDSARPSGSKNSTSRTNAELNLIPFLL